MDQVSDDGRREAIIFVLKKLRRMTLDGFKFGREYYDFEFYAMDFDEAQKTPAVMHEIDALRYLDQKGVLEFSEGDEPDESLVSRVQEEKFQQELTRFRLIDDGTVITGGVAQHSRKSDKRPAFNRATGVVTYKDQRLQLAPSTKQYYVVKACLAKWGKQVSESNIFDELETARFDINDRVVRDSVPRLNKKFKDAFNIENAFLYSSGYVSIDPSQFETH